MQYKNKINKRKVLALATRGYSIATADPNSICPSKEYPCKESLFVNIFPQHIHIYINIHLHYRFYRVLFERSRRIYSKLSSFGRFLLPGKFLDIKPNLLRISRKTFWSRLSPVERALSSHTLLYIDFWELHVGMRYLISDASSAMGHRSLSPNFRHNMCVYKP